MRSVAAFLCFCAVTVAAAAAPEHRSREFNGVTAGFTLLNPSLRLSQPLKVAFSLRNHSSKPVEFRYIKLLEHEDVFTAKGVRVDYKMGAPTFESPAYAISLKPGQTFRSSEEIPLSVWYDLAPGDYYLVFRYDLRLLPDSVMKAYRRKLHSDDWVTWDKKKYWFHIHR